jgi:hypothetical protein
MLAFKEAGLLLREAVDASPAPKAREHGEDAADRNASKPSQNAGKAGKKAKKLAGAALKVPEEAPSPQSAARLEMATPEPASHNDSIRR